ncbi:MAG: hypothetical protein L3J89_09080 [Gammaproteobacteria bacterium]|nr:hypothetical protein [Gammaproteobacteria bacterium]MCF6324462.1 hypothetical protein [Gammaproteobacteria bacterium]
MRFRFRLGPLTFGKSGTRLSLWKGGTGISIPLSKKNKGGTFGKVKAGPVMAFFGSPFGKSSTQKNCQEETHKLPSSFSPDEEAAIEAFNSDEQFINKLQKYGVPWRGVQEKLKEALPKHVRDRNNIAYKLVPKAMNAVFGKQNTAWKTEKRPSKSGNGQTTWVVTL